MTQDFEPHFALCFKTSILISIADQNKTRHIQLVLMANSRCRKEIKKKEDEPI